MFGGKKRRLSRRLKGGSQDSDGSKCVGICPSEDLNNMLGGKKRRLSRRLKGGNEGGNPLDKREEDSY